MNDPQKIPMSHTIAIPPANPIVNLAEGEAGGYQLAAVRACRAAGLTLEQLDRGVLKQWRQVIERMAAHGCRCADYLPGTCPACDARAALAGREGEMI